jgi:hypothetical protein
MIAVPLAEALIPARRWTDIPVFTPRRRWYDPFVVFPVTPVCSCEFRAFANLV